MNISNSNEDIRAALKESGIPTNENTARDVLIGLCEQNNLWTQEKASVVPDSYKARYGADQNCGDDVAERLKGYDPHEISADNNIDADAKWGTGRLLEGKKPLNNGMIRMNLGNVLRGRIKRGEYVIIGTKEYNEDAKAA